MNLGSSAQNITHSFHLSPELLSGWSY